jgi:hypothetical protein
VSPDLVGLLRAAAAPAYDLGGPTEVPPFRVRRVDAATAARAVDTGRVKHVGGELCAVFRDPATGRFFAQLAPEGWR